VVDSYNSCGESCWLLSRQLSFDNFYPLENVFKVFLHILDSLCVLLEVVLCLLKPGGGETVDVGEHLVGLLEPLQHLLLRPHDQLYVLLVDHTGQPLDQDLAGGVVLVDAALHPVRPHLASRTIHSSDETRRRALECETYDAETRRESSDEH